MHVEIRLRPRREPLSPWRWTRCEGPCSGLYREWTFGDAPCAVAAARLAGCGPEAREAALSREVVLFHADMAVIAADLKVSVLMAEAERVLAEVAQLRADIERAA